jgi:hypothetical protein
VVAGPSTGGLGRFTRADVVAVSAAHPSAPSDSLKPACA